MTRPSAPFRFCAAIAVAVIWTFTSSCGGAGIVAGDATIATVSIDPASQTLRVGATLQLTARAVNSRNAPVAGSFTFTSSDAAVVSVSATGLARALRVGAAFVTARAANAEATALITVTTGVPFALAKMTGDSITAEAQSRLPVAPAVRVQDSVGNAVAGAVVTFAVSAGGGTITGGSATTDAIGVATLGSWTLGPAIGQNTLTVSVNGGAAPLTTSFTVTALPPRPTQLVVTAASTAAVGGVPFAIQPVVEVRGQGGALIPGATNPVTVTATPRIGGTTTANATGGTARFSDLVVFDAGVHTLTFSSPGLASATLVVAIAPGAVLSAKAATFAATRGLADPDGQLVPVTNTGTGGPITGVAIASTTYGESSKGWLKVTLLGNATPTNLLLEPRVGALTPGTYTVKIALQGVNTQTVDVPITFVVSGLPPVALVLAREPVGGLRGDLLATQPVIELRDSLGLVASQRSDSVTVSIRNGPGYLSGTLSVAAANGIAKFTDLTLNAAGAFVLAFSTSGLPVVTSRPLTVTGKPGLYFTSYPVAGTTRVALSPQPVVVVQDQNGQPVTLFLERITMTIQGIGGASGVLSGTTTLLTVDGVAKFTDLVITGTPGDYILTATDDWAPFSTSVLVRIR